MARREIAQNEGFRNLDPRSTSSEYVIDGLTNEMNLRQIDKDLENSFGKTTRMIQNFKQGGKWDYKDFLKNHLPTYFHKTLKNDKGEPATIIAFEIPGDDDYVYSFDILGNVHYGATLPQEGYPENVVHRISELQM